jgi:cytochrome b
MPDARQSGQVPAWSGFVRVSHWLVAACVAVNLFNETGWWHRMIGYFCLALVGLRIVYGCWNRQPSSRLWWPTLDDIRHHLHLVAGRMPDTGAGHNPLGQYAVYLMWALIAHLGLTGWLSRTDALWGEDWPVDFHALLADALLGMVVLHLIAVPAMSFLQKRNLIKAMLRDDR